MEAGRLQKAIELKNFLSIRYGEEHCKVALLLSALLIVPLRDVVAVCLSPYMSPAFARGAGYVIFGTAFFLVFFIPFLCRLTCKLDMFLLGGFILSGLLFFGLRRPEEINVVYGLLLAKSMLMAFPYYIVARTLKDYGMLERALYNVSFLINAAVLLSIQYRVALGGGYSMGAAYAVLPGAIIAFRMLLRRPSFWAVLNAGASLGALAFSGTRGPVACYVLFCSYELTRNHTLAKKGIIKKLIAACVVGCVFLAGSSYITEKEFFSSEILMEHGLSTRLFRPYDRGRGAFTSDLVRQYIWEGAEKSFMESNPFIGMGLLEERMKIFLRSGISLDWERSAIGYQGYYSHLIFLDWLLEYGIVAGGIISLSALFFIYKIFFMPCGVHRSCLELFFFIGFVPLLFSNIWHEDRLFYSIFGLVVSTFWKRSVYRNGGVGST